LLRKSCGYLPGLINIVQVQLPSCRNSTGCVSKTSYMSPFGIWTWRENEKWERLNILIKFWYSITPVYIRSSFFIIYYRFTYFYHFSKNFFKNSNVSNLNHVNHIGTIKIYIYVYTKPYMVWSSKKKDSF
jgi:hypothetical protein